MSKRINKLTWLEQNEASAGGMKQPNMQVQPNAQPQLAPEQGAGSQNTQNPDQPLEPVAPDMPDNDVLEFHTWRNEFFKLAIQGDVNKMLDSLNEIKNQNLNSSQVKFIDDNFQICLLRQDANFDKVSKNVRKSIKSDIDKEHPAVSLMQIISPALEENPVLSEILIKLFGYHALKGELHRKFIAAVTGSVQVAGGGNKEDLVFNDKEFSINISTRMASEFGEIQIGRWSLQEDDTNKFLSEPELVRLKDGSPEEKKALSHRVVMESISDKFKTRAFIIHVVKDNGDTYNIGWDIGESIKVAYKDGKLIVKSDKSFDSDVAIDESGEFVQLKNISVYAKIPGNEPDEDGKVQSKEVPFIENRSGVLYFVADVATLNAISSDLSGILFQNKPFTGSQIEFNRLTKQVVSLSELLLRRG